MVTKAKSASTSQSRFERPPIVSPLRRAGSAGHDLLVQLLVDGLHRAVDLGAGRAELIGNQLNQEVDPLDKWRAPSNPTRSR